MRACRVDRDRATLCTAGRCAQPFRSQRSSVVSPTFACPHTPTAGSRACAFLGVCHRSSLGSGLTIDLASQDHGGQVVRVVMAFTPRPQCSTALTRRVPWATDGKHAAGATVAMIMHSSVWLCVEHPQGRDRYRAFQIQCLRRDRSLRLVVRRDPGHRRARLGAPSLAA